MKDNKEVKQGLEFLEKDTYDLYSLINYWSDCVYSNNSEIKEIAKKIYNKISLQYHSVDEVRNEYTKGFEKYIHKLDFLDKLKSGVYLIIGISVIRFLDFLIMSKMRLSLLLIAGVSFIISSFISDLIEKYEKKVKYPYLGTKIANEISPETLMKITQGIPYKYFTESVIKDFVEYEEENNNIYITPIKEYYKAKEKEE